MKATAKKQLKTWFAALEEMQTAAETLAKEMQETIDERSDKWRETEAGELAAEEQNNVQSFADYLENAKDQIDEYVSE